MGTHLKALNESYLMDTNMIWLKWFSKNLYVTVLVKVALTLEGFWWRTIYGMFSDSLMESDRVLAWSVFSLKSPGLYSLLVPYIFHRDGFLHGNIRKLVVSLEMFLFARRRFAFWFYESGMLVTYITKLIVDCFVCMHFPTMQWNFDIVSISIS